MNRSTAVLTSPSVNHHQQYAGNIKVIHASLLKKAVAGGFAGGFSCIVGHPLDTVKVRLQTEENQLGDKAKNYMRHKGFPRPESMNIFRAPFDCAIKIIRYEGFRGFYKGMLFPLIAGIPWCAATFYGYSLGERLCESRIPPGQFSNKKVIVAGSTAGCFNAIVACPIERVKCLLQVQQDRVSNSSVRYKGPFHCAHQVYLEGGLFRGNFKGFCSTLLRRGPGYGVHFFVYENVKQLFRQRNKRSDVTGVEMIIAGGLAGMASCTYWIAPDTIKSRIQSAPCDKYRHGIRSALREMKLRGDGFSTLYRGYVPVLIRAFPTCSVYMFSYEYFLKFLV